MYPPAELDAALSSRELRAAVTDFKHDPATNRIELVPFAEDLPELPAPAQRADHADKLAALAEGCTSLATDLKQDAPTYRGRSRAIFAAMPNRRSMVPDTPIPDCSATMAQR